MADRDPVEVAAEALADKLGVILVLDRGDFAATIRDAIATALRTEAGEAMREAAAQVAEAAGKPWALHTATGAMVFRAATEKIAQAIRALPLSDAPASPWPKVAKQMADALEAAYEDANDQKVADLIDVAIVAYKRTPTPPAKDEQA